MVIYIDAFEFQQHRCLKLGKLEKLYLVGWGSLAQNEVKTDQPERVNTTVKRLVNLILPLSWRLFVSIFVHMQVHLTYGSSLGVAESPTGSQRRNHLRFFRELGKAC